MQTIQREYIVDETGNPHKVVLSLADFRLIEEMLGLDLDETALEDLRRAARDRAEELAETYLDLDDIV